MVGIVIAITSLKPIVVLVSRFQHMVGVDVDWLCPESHITIENVLGVVSLLTRRSSRKTLADLLVNYTVAVLF
jgi:hypothetical protein